MMSKVVHNYRKWFKFLLKAGEFDHLSLGL